MLKEGAPYAPGPPKFTPVMPSASEMSLTPLFSVSWNIARRDTLTEPVFTRFGDITGVQATAPFLPHFFVIKTIAGKILRRESMLARDRVSNVDRVAAVEDAVHADGALFGDLPRI